MSKRANKYCPIIAAKEEAKYAPFQESEGFKQLVDHNIWHTNFKDLFDTILNLVGEESNWLWVFNSKCKYIDIRIDMRDGGFILKDREGNRISLDALKFQVGGGIDAN